MLTKLTLENFLAHARTEIAFGPGITVLVGPNNTGKSAVVEALRCLAENPPSRGLIRHGAKEARVTAEFTDLADGAPRVTRVAWVRKKLSAIYEVTRPGEESPEVYAKFGRTPPEEVTAVLRLARIPVESGEAVDVHIGNQREPVFLIDRPGSVTASFLAASSESAHLIAMRNLLQNKTREARQEERSLLSRSAALRAELDRLAELPGVELAIQKAATEKARIEAGQAALDALAAARARLRALAKARAAVLARRESLKPLAPAPTPESAAPLAAHLAARARLMARKGALAAKAERLSPLAEPPQAAPTAGLVALGRRLAAARARLSRVRGRSAALSPLAAAPEPFSCARLAAHLRRERALRRTAGLLAARATNLSALASPPAPADCSSLTAAIVALSRLRAARETAKNAVAAAAERLRQGQAVIEARLTAIGACPLCRAELTPGRFLEEGHAHG